MGTIAPVAPILMAPLCSKIQKEDDTKHIGVLDLKIIANNTNLLMILISTTFAASGSTGVPNEAKFLWEFIF